MCLWIYSSIQLENQIVKLWMTLDVYWNRIYIEDRVAAMPDDITENFRNVRIFSKQCQLRMESSDDD